MNDTKIKAGLTANDQIVQELIGDDSMYEALMEIMEPWLVLRDKTKVEEGVQKGEFKELYSLVCDNLISMEIAAARKNLTANEFRKKLQELDII